MAWSLVKALNKGIAQAKAGSIVRLSHINRHDCQATLAIISEEIDSKGKKNTRLAKVGSILISLCPGPLRNLSLLSRISNPRVTLQSKKLIYNSLDDIWKSITMRQMCK